MEQIISDGLQNILDNYLEVKNSQNFSAEQIIWPAFLKLIEDFKSYPLTKEKANIKYKWGVGKGNWAKIPWIGFLDNRETERIQDGVYVVYLFRQDMGGVYLTLNQGVTDLKSKFGVKKRRKVLADKAMEIRKECDGLKEDGFILDNNIDLKVERGLGADYEVSTIAYKYYESNNIPSDKQLIEDLDIILNKYQRYVEEKITTGINIDFDKLRKVIAKHIEPLWDFDLDESKLLRPGGGEYFVQSVYEKAFPHLQPQEINENTKENIAEALKSHVVLLSQYEYMHAKTFLEHSNVSEMKNNMNALLFSNESLENRFFNFINWSKTVKAPVLSAKGKETKMGMNQTVASYLLAMSNPNEYAYCKPETYSIAVEELIGGAYVETDQVQRILHCNEFYKEIYKFLVDEYGLANGNLLDVHSIFHWLKDKDENGLRFWDVNGEIGERRSWLFQAKQGFYDVDRAVRDLKQISWTVSQYKDQIHKGDKVFIWESGPYAGICASAIVLDEPEERKEYGEELKYWLKEGHINEKLLRVSLNIDKIPKTRLLKSILKDHPDLENLSILKRSQGTNFPVSIQEAQIVEEMMMAIPAPEAIMDLSEITSQFAASLLESHISFGSRHEEIVRSFVASLATKRLAILTGLSGSGKTQIAIKFGEWLGKDRLKVIPVRPDWTGPEPLFGYEDALQPCSDDGRHAWHVPDALEFMLEAVKNPDYPYLLLLDEMNLAHVERYFADYLSGMESEYECLPNLIKEDGLWRPVNHGKEQLPIPDNLFVVGTVNIDETTYMFSPKVLDRGNTFEFRVSTDDLNEAAKKPISCKPGNLGLVRGFLEIAKDDQWQEKNPANKLDDFTSHLKNIHTLLAKEGFEFGHRTFYEAIRFASMLSSAASENILHALDLQVMQKVLPRIHGSRRRLEGLLCAIGKFCFSLETDGNVNTSSWIKFEELDASDAKLRISFDKAKRMVKSLRANQFTSFTE